MVPVAKRRFASGRAILALILREMSTTYGRSPIGYLWAILEPVAGIAILAVVFMAFLRSPPVGTNFAIFYATGMLPFLMYMQVSVKTMQTLGFSRSLLAYPSVTFADALLARFILTVLTKLVVSVLVFTGIMLLFETRTLPDLPKIALSFSMAACLGFGVGALNCVIAGFSPGWQQVWAIVNRPMFLISCIFFPYEGVPQPYRDWLWYNPLVHAVGQMRLGFYPYYDAAYVSPLYVFSLALVLSAAGLLFMNRYYRDILYR